MPVLVKGNATSHGLPPVSAVTICIGFAETEKVHTAGA